MNNSKSLNYVFFLYCYKICIKTYTINSLWNGYQYSEPAAEKYYLERVCDFIYATYVVTKLLQYSGKVWITWLEPDKIQNSQKTFSTI